MADYFKFVKGVFVPRFACCRQEFVPKMILAEPAFLGPNMGKVRPSRAYIASEEFHNCLGVNLRQLYYWIE